MRTKLFCTAPPNFLSWIIPLCIAFFALVVQTAQAAVWCNANPVPDETIKTLQRDVDNRLANYTQPRAIARIHTEGTLPHKGIWDQSVEAKKDFPQIDFARSIMVGNNVSDMLFGRNAGMHTVFLKTTSPDLALPHEAIDLSFDSLIDFAKALQKA